MVWGKLRTQHGPCRSVGKRDGGEKRRRKGIARKSGVFQGRLSREKMNGEKKNNLYSS